MKETRALVSNKRTIDRQHIKNSDDEKEDDDGGDVDEKDDDRDRDDDVTRAAMQSRAEQWRWLRRTISNLDGSMFAIGTPTYYNQVLSIPILFNAPIFFLSQMRQRLPASSRAAERHKDFFKWSSFPSQYQHLIRVIRKIKKTLPFLW